MAIFNTMFVPADWTAVQEQCCSVSDFGTWESRKKWQDVAYSLHAAEMEDNADPDTLRDIFLEISRKSSGYTSDRDVIKTWTSTSRPRIGTDCARKFLRDHGVNVPRRIGPSRLPSSQQSLVHVYQAHNRRSCRPMDAENYRAQHIHTDSKMLIHNSDGSKLVAHIHRLLFGTEYYFRVLPTMWAYGHSLDSYGFDCYTYRDRTGQIFGVKKIRYGEDGHRIRDPRLTTVVTKGFCSACLYGEHLMNLSDTSRPVGVVESEKTAEVLAILLPSYQWVATGGMENAVVEKLTAPWVEQWRKGGGGITLFPDLDEINTTHIWRELASHLAVNYAPDVVRGYTKWLTSLGYAKADFADYILHINTHNTYLRDSEGKDRECLALLRQDMNEFTDFKKMFNKFQLWIPKE